MARKRPEREAPNPPKAEDEEEDDAPARQVEEDDVEDEEAFSGSLELDSGDGGDDSGEQDDDEDEDGDSEENEEEESSEAAHAQGDADDEDEDASDDDDDDDASDDDDDDDDDDDHEEQVRDAIRDYAHTVALEAKDETRRRRRRQAAKDAGAAAPDAAAANAADADAAPGDDADPATDSSEEERPHRNTVGDVPLDWYRAEDHIGYDAEGAKIAKSSGGSGGRDALDALVARADDPAGALLRTVYDAYNDEVVRLTDEEVRMVMRVRRGLFPHVEVDPHAPYVDWFSGDVSAVPLRGGGAEPKRRFVPSRHEEAKVVKLVRALRAGWLKTRREQRKAARRARAGAGAGGLLGPSGLYLLWGEDDAGGGGGAAQGPDDPLRRTGASLAHLAPQKPRLPGHAESYRPPPEYVPTEEEARARSLASAEANGWPDDSGAPDGVRRDADGTPVVLDEDGKRAFVPRAHDALRHVPAYGRFVHERFERCLDLYLCPRVRRKRMHIDPETLVPKLPKPADLKPFPHQLAHRFVGHAGRVRCLAPHPTGQWLATGGEDGAVRLWEVRTGRCVRRWALGGGAKGGGAAAGAVTCVAWCPHPRPVCVLAAAVGRSVLLLPTGLGGEAGDAVAAAKLAAVGLALLPAAGEDGAAPAAAAAAADDEDDGDKEERAAAAAAVRAAAEAGAPGEPGPVKDEAELRAEAGRAGGLGEEGDLTAGGKAPGQAELCAWRPCPPPLGDGALELRHRFPVAHLSWHRGGDYLVTVAPTGNTQVSVDFVLVFLRVFFFAAAAPLFFPAAALPPPPSTATSQRTIPTFFSFTVCPRPPRSVATTLVHTPDGSECSRPSAPVRLWTAAAEAPRSPTTPANPAPRKKQQSVLVHQLSRRATQSPFRKSKGRVVRALFHPTKPFLFVASQSHVRVYNLAKQQLARRLGAPSASALTALAIHPSGDHVLTGGADRRVAWFDLDLGSTAYRALRYHGGGVRAVAFHPGGYPLFASAGDDGHAHVFHGQVYADLLTNPLIVPLKVLKGHGVVDSGGVLDVAFHPTQPWLFTAGADGTAALWCH